MGQVNHTSQVLSAGLVSIGFLAVAAMALPAAAETVRMEGTFNDLGSADAAQIVVSGHAGRFDRVSGATLQIPLTLDASFGEGGSGRKIVGSDLFLKQSGTAAGASATDARDGTVPGAKVALQKTFGFNVDQLGPVAQSAIALCNSAAATSVNMSLPVVWRVTTGRFNFKWVNYDQVGPSEDIVSNPEFYADRETHEIDIAAIVPVRCEGTAPVSAAPKAAAKPAVERSETVEEPAPAKTAVDVTPDPVSNAMLVSHKEFEAGEVAAKPVSVATSDTRMVCDGGMIRSNGSGATEVCLCPGNTRRNETGANAFACERKVGRR